jgi:nucleoside-diphosphate-sugar epimerase
VPLDEVRAWIERIPMPVALTGGTGFVGSHLVDALCAAGVEPRVLVRDPESPRWIAGQPVELVPGHLHDEEALRRLVVGAGTVIHLAGVVRAGSQAEFDRGNRVGTARLVEAVGETAPGAHLVHVSSLAAAGPSLEPEGIGPEAEPRPVSAYGRSKLGAEQAVEAIGTERRWTILRPPAIYGPRDTDVFQFFRMAAAGWMAAPAGDRWLTVAHVRDVVRAILAAAAGLPGGVLHLGEPQPHRLVDLLRQLAAAGGVRARVVRVPAAVLTVAGGAGSLLQLIGLRRVAMTRDKAREMLACHWTARTADSLQILGISDWTRFAEGAAEAWSWYRSHGWLSRC